MRRMNLTAAGRIAGRWIPTDSTEVKHPKGYGVVYTSANTSDSPYLPCRLAAAQRPFHAVAYRGTSNKSDWIESFKTEAERDAKIARFFENLDSRKAQLAGWRNERKLSALKEVSKRSGDLSFTTVAVLVRESLTISWPGIKFSVRSKSYSGGCSIDVSWNDGPTEKQVNPLLNAFQGSDFDGMQDLKTYRGESLFDGKLTNFHVDFVHGYRRQSLAALRQAAFAVAFELDLPLLTVKDNGNIEDGGEGVPYCLYNGPTEENEVLIVRDGDRTTQYRQLVYDYAHRTSLAPDNTKRDEQLARFTTIEDAAEQTIAVLAGRSIDDEMNSMGIDFE